MKCDELETEYLYEDRVITPATHCIAYYRASQVDEAIAELRKENESLKYSVATLDTDLAMATRWRKCSEEMPTIGQEVIFLAKYKTDRIRMWIGDYRSIGCNECVFYTSCPGWGCEFLPSEIIGWMPQPKAPEVR